MYNVKKPQSVASKPDRKPQTEKIYYVYLHDHADFKPTTIKEALTFEFISEPDGVFDNVEDTIECIKKNYLIFGLHGFVITGNTVFPIHTKITVEGFPLDDD